MGLIEIGYSKDGIGAPFFTTEAMVTNVMSELTGNLGPISARMDAWIRAAKDSRANQQIKGKWVLFKKNAVDLLANWKSTKAAAGFPAKRYNYDKAREFSKAILSWWTFVQKNPPRAAIPGERVSGCFGHVGLEDLLDGVGEVEENL